MVKLLRIENVQGYGFETSVSQKRREVFNPNERCAFTYVPRVLNKKKYTRQIKLTKIESIQLYVAISQCYEFLPLHELSKNILKEDNGFVKSLTFMDEHTFVEELEKRGFFLWEYEVPDVLVSPLRHLTSNEIRFTVDDMITKRLYVPRKTLQRSTETLYDFWDIRKNRKTLRSQYI